MHLDLAQRQVLRKVSAGDDKVGALFDRGASCSFVCFKDDDSKVFGAKEGRGLCADEGEA